MSAKDALRESDLVDCDVVLYRGDSWLARAIRFFDGTDVHHAGLYLAPGKIAEALGPGVVDRPISQSLRDSQWAICRRLEPEPGSMRPVRDRAVAFLAAGHRYAYEQLVLLAFLCLTRKLTPTPSLHVFVRSALDSAAARIAKLLAGGREPMICSEFVYRCYDFPGRRGNRFRLKILSHAAAPRRSAGGTASPAAPLGRGIHPQSLLVRWGVRRSRSAPRAVDAIRAPAGVPAARLARLFEAHLRELRTARRTRAALAADPNLEAAIDRFAAVWAQAHGKPRRRTAAPVTRPAAPDPRWARMHLLATAADFVTPGDLLHSASLATIGTLAGGRHARRTAKPARRGARTSKAARR